MLTVTLALQMTLEDVAEGRDETPDWGVTLADLVGGDGRVAITDAMSVPAAQLEAVCRGKIFMVLDPSYWNPPNPGLGPSEIMALVTQKTMRDDLANILQRSGLAEQRLAHLSRSNR